MALLAVETHGLTKRFNGKAVVDQVDLKVPAGTIFGFLGPNGAGKTTTIRMLMGFAHPSAGQAFLLGQPAGQGLPGVGFLPDVPAFYPWMTAPEYLTFVGRLHGMSGKSLVHRMGELLELADLKGVTTRIGGYSRGMKQRLGLAQALVNQPRLVILDEPTSALDPMGRKDVLEMMVRLSGETTVFFSTHILADVERVAHRVGILHQGRLIRQDALSALRASYALAQLELEVVGPSHLLARALPQADWVSHWQQQDHQFTLTVKDVEVAYHQLPRLLSELELGIRRLEPSHPSLEDVFVRLVTET